MLSIGCIQSQKCHTDSCPTGIATQNSWLARGLDPTLKSERPANYIKTLRRDLLKVSEACGVEHPGLIATDDLDILEGVGAKSSLREVYDYEKGWGTTSMADQMAIIALMAANGSGSPRPTTA